MTKIISAHVVEGDLYEIEVEAGVAFTFSCVVIAHTADGRVLVHSTFAVSGHARGEDGLDYVVPSRALAQAFADKVMARGFINESLWEVMPDREPLEVLWDREFEREVREERNGRLFG